MERCPLRCAVRVGTRSPGAAPIRPVSSSSISSCSAVARISASDVDREASLPVCARTVRIGQTRTRPSCGTSSCRSYEIRTVASFITGTVTRWACYTTSWDSPPQVGTHGPVNRLPQVLRIIRFGGLVSARRRQVVKQRLAELRVLDASARRSTPSSTSPSRTTAPCWPRRRDRSGPAASIIAIVGEVHRLPTGGHSPRSPAAPPSPRRRATRSATDSTGAHRPLNKCSTSP